MLYLLPALTLEYGNSTNLRQNRKEQSHTFHEYQPWSYTSKEMYKNIEFIEKC